MMAHSEKDEPPVTVHLTPTQTAIAQQYAKVALQFSAPIFYWNSQGTLKLNHGNVSLIKIGGRKFGITNNHVVESFRERKASGEGLLCQIGSIPIDLLSRIHSCSPLMDLAVLDLSEVNAGNIRGTNDLPPSQFHEPDGWPPQMPKSGDWALLGGFPLTKRIQLGQAHFEFGTFSSGGTLIHSVQPDLITCRIEIEKCVISIDRDGRGLEDLPGISGSPVMVARQLASRITVFDLIGVVFEHSMSWDLLRIRPLSLVDSNGYIAC
jgi:hypothetical protein